MNDKKRLLELECREKIKDMLAEVMHDTMAVFDFGHTVHPDAGDTPNFLMPDGNKCDLKTRGKCTLGHVAAAHLNPGAVEDESGLSHLLHAISDCAILYIRHKRNIVHPTDA
jgi:hypothetical protein